MNPSDTIVAISSPPGGAARGIIRLTGPICIEIAEKLFEAGDHTSLSDFSSSRWVEGFLILPEARIPGSIYLFRQPHSFTREDMVEFHTLGSPVLLAELMEACLRLGARRAEAGEFTARAYLAGAFDLSQVHGIAGLIAAQSEDQMRAAERLLHGSLASTANAAREELADLLSLVEGALDFADEPIEFITPPQLIQRLASVAEILQRTWSTGLSAERWGQFPRVVLVGPPNVGKSSLLNRLTGQDRVISSPMSGTTRDSIEANWSLGKSACVLVNIAGLDNVTSRLDADAQRVARDAIQNADLLLVVSDTTRDITAVAEFAKPMIHVMNKCDLVDNVRRATIRAEMAKFSGAAPVFVSASTGDGCEELGRAVAEALQGRQSTTQDAAVALMAEHQEALKTAVESTQRALALAQSAGDHLEQADLVAAELHSAADALGILVGKDLTEERLGRIFSRFCVGK